MLCKNKRIMDNVVNKVQSFREIQEFFLSSINYICPLNFPTCMIIYLFDYLYNIILIILHHLIYFYKNNQLDSLVPISKSVLKL